MKSVIEIEVKGDTGSGKTEVMQIIKNALIAFYGPHTQVASYDLASEAARGDVLERAKATGQCCDQKRTLFVLSETNQQALRRIPVGYKLVLESSLAVDPAPATKKVPVKKGK